MILAFCLVLLALVLCPWTLHAQQVDPSTQTRLELIQSSRDYLERVCAQTVMQLTKEKEEAQAQAQKAQAELSQLKQLPTEEKKP